MRSSTIAIEPPAHWLSAFTDADRSVMPLRPSAERADALGAERAKVSAVLARR
jgi:hypothetical protein